MHRPENASHPVVVHAAPLRAAVHAIFTAAGSSAREAQLIAAQLVEANLTGHDSHGVGMVPRYIEVLRGGHLKPNQHAKVTLDSGAMLSLDGNEGYGQVMGFEAMEHGIARAREHGTAVVALRNSHHIGRIGHWAEQCLAAGLVSMHYVNVVSEPVVAPFGGRDARFQTNPFCVGIPLPGRMPILLDFATSRIAMGKVRVAMNKGEQVKPHTLLDRHGEWTTDPRELFARPDHGAIVPFGEHKGYGLAIVCELLGGALTGGRTLHAKPASRAIWNSMLSIIIDPERLGTLGNLSAEAEEYIRWVRASPAADGVDRVRMPGEPEEEHRAERGANGIPIDATTWGEIVGAGGHVGVTRAKLEEIARLA
ncbi:MAG TPA: malate/lactate/ureidoglycolate dehydrogenase [Usitatibacter sp.]|nr:malate/lactate/ureidoglycolate dehydrogenase [Usitatibacter sp.]